MQIVQSEDIINGSKKWQSVRKNHLINHLVFIYDTKMDY